MAAVSVRRIPIQEDGVVGVVFEPAGGSDQFAVMLGGSYGGFSEAPARAWPNTAYARSRLATSVRPGFRLRSSRSRSRHSSVASIGFRWLRRGTTRRTDGVLEGAELALVLGARLGSSVRRVVAVAPSNVVWFG